MPFELPDLPYPYDALEPHIDAETMQIHHDAHHKAYVDNANAALAGTEWADRPVEAILSVGIDGLLDAEPGLAVAQERRAAARHRRLGARVLPQVQEQAPGLPRGLVERRELGRGRQAVRRGAR